MRLNPRDPRRSTTVAMAFNGGPPGRGGPGASRRGGGGSAGFESDRYASPTGRTAAGRTPARNGRRDETDGTALHPHIIDEMIPFGGLLLAIHRPGPEQLHWWCTPALISCYVPGTDGRMYRATDADKERAFGLRLARQPLWQAAMRQWPTVFPDGVRERFILAISLEGECAQPYPHRQDTWGDALRACGVKYCGEWNEMRQRWPYRAALVESLFPAPSALAL